MLKEPLSLLIKILSELSSTSRETGVSLGNLLTISDKSLDGTVTVSYTHLTLPTICSV